MARIIFIRHGQAAFGSQRYDSLTDLGKAQAKAVGDHFSACKVSFDRVVAGEPKRQQASAALALSVMNTPRDVAVCSDFNEYDHMGIIEAAHPLIARSHPHLTEALEARFSNHTFQPFFEEALSLWMGGMRLPSGVESFDAFAGRVRSGLKGLAAGLASRETVAVFSSGGVIAMALGGALNLSPSESMILSWELVNGGYSTLRVGKRGIRLMNANVSAHLALLGREWVTYR